MMAAKDSPVPVTAGNGARDALREDRTSNVNPSPRKRHPAETRTTIGVVAPLSVFFDPVPTLIRKHWPDSDLPRLVLIGGAAARAVEVTP